MSRAEIFARIDHALADVTTLDPAADVPVPWTYGQPTAVADPIELFVERVEDYKAIVDRCASQSDIPGMIAAALASHGSTTVVVPEGIDRGWLSALDGVSVTRDVPPLSRDELNRTDAVLTAAAVGMAESGTIALDHRADQGRRALSLVPDVHVCVVRVDQVVTDVPEAMARLQASIADGQPITWISGGSATSDIELSRVEGVHGPRTLHVILVG